jgi:hypothetical protein
MEKTHTISSVDAEKAFIMTEERKQGRKRPLMN